MHEATLEVKDTGVQEFRSSGVQQFGGAAVQEFRSTGFSAAIAVLISESRRQSF
jgi:hypothetical protein